MLRKPDVSRSVFRILTVGALMLGVGLTSTAGAQTTGGAIAGVVADTQGGVLPGVTLTARNVESGQPSRKPTGDTAWRDWRRAATI